MKVVILAAGKGTRLHGYTNGAPKCLLTINDETLLAREIRLLNEVGIKSSDILVVAGYKADMLLDCGAKVIVNDEYDTTDNAYSLKLALEQIKDDDVMVMDGDLVFDKEILQNILACGYDNFVCTQESDDLQESTGIVFREDKSVVAIGKQYHNSGYVYISIFRFSRKVLEDFVKELAVEESVKTWYTLALTKVMKKYSFYNLIVNGRWHEIDFVEDYLEVKQIFETKE